MNHRKQSQTVLLGTLCYLLTAGAPAYAADTEIYEGGICTTTRTETITRTTQATTPANVVFIVDTSGSMGWTVAGNQNTSPSDPSRLEIVKGVFGNLINTLVSNNSGINAALMRFDAQNSSDNSGGYFIKSMQSINADTKDGFIAAVNGLTASSRTPLAETLYEATLYFLGSPEHFGTNQNVSGVLSGNNYISPISTGSKNYVVYLTDGTPNKDDAADSLVGNLPNWNGGTCGFVTASNLNGNEAANSDDCLDEIAYYLKTRKDVTTYTIGFTTDQQLLQDTATNGGGQYFTTSTANGLTDILTQIIQNISTETVTITETSTADVIHTRGTFVPPAIGIDAFNRTSHRNALYFALFQNNNEAIWDGNVKAYKLSSDNPLRIVDFNDTNVLDAGGHFIATSQSLWASGPDGDAIVNGGANAELPTTRTLYTKASNTAGALTALGAADPTLFGLVSTDTTQRDAYVATAQSSIIADPLHSQAVVVNYGGTEASPDISLFVGTNAGFLHAINAVTGVEQFAYVPKELLASNVTQLGQPGSHRDGLDGSPVIWKTDADNNGLVNGTDHVYLYIGMRKGGSNYYALNVTNRSSPALKWVIEGGSGNYAELGESWSKPVLATMKHNGTATKVLVFAGGYSSANTAGRAIYVVNADTGARLWWAGPANSGANVQVTDFTHSIPSDLRVIDSDMDGYADRLYVGDMGGHVFRVDFTDNSGIAGTVTTLASLGANRQFFYAPDVVLTQPTPGASMYYSINIGSGDREHPKSDTTSQDRFYSIKDHHVHDSNFSGYTVVLESAMLNANTLITGTATDREAAAGTLNSATNPGWYIPLATGEKVLAEAMTINGTLYFTTYVPPTTGLTDCPPPIGNGRLYTISLFSGVPMNNGQDPDDRYIELTADGIPPRPVVVFPKSACTSNCDSQPEEPPAICIGGQCDTTRPTVQFIPTYWKQQ